MAQLLVRNIEDSLVRKLKRRAAERGVSAEEEHRRILADALGASTKAPLTFKEHLLSMADVAPDLVIERERTRSPQRRVKF
ncbi:MAG: FitA-like ribbon-helix-helix domain-containing protein [Roseimicrobium sp.]